MKNMNRIPEKQAKPSTTQIPKPEIRDNLDSRKNKEFEKKGDKVTHTEKNVKSRNKKV